MPLNKETKPNYTVNISLVGFRSLVEEESTYWALVNLLNLQNELMDVHQSDISKMLLFSTSNLVSFMFIKSRHFTWAYNVLLHKTSHTSCVLFFFWFPRASSSLWHYYYNISFKKNVSKNGVIIMGAVGIKTSMYNSCFIKYIFLYATKSFIHMVSSIR